MELIENNSNEKLEKKRKIQVYDSESLGVVVWF